MSKLTKRSYLIQVAGAAGLAAISGATAKAQPNLQLPGGLSPEEMLRRARGQNNNQSGSSQQGGQPQTGGQPGQRTGITDNDSSDRSNYGRGTMAAQNRGEPTGVTDTDPSDVENYGRGQRQSSSSAGTETYTGINDADRNPGDRSGYGRGPR